MNSSRHANRSNRDQASGRGGGGGGRGQGRGDRQHNGHSEFSSVPSIQQVIVGAPVSIVLKVDQPTGRQVQGTVAELLTRGNHPRGIKVRLQDGRVGRVQMMATEEQARIGSEGLAGLGRNGEREGGDSFPSFAVRNGNAASSGIRYSDFRVDSPDQPERVEASLADYVVTKPKGKAKKGSSMASDAGNLPPANFEYSTAQPPPLALSVCPVCGEFEGDEMAVAHHVNSHFD